jgi:GT2 family glycosyltransferase
VEKMSQQPSVAVIIVSRNRPDLVERSVKQFEQDSYPNKDILVVECGTESENLTSYPTISYPDDDFKGKCFGHNVGLNYLNMQKTYDYYLFCMNDVFINDKSDFVAEMIGVMNDNPRLGCMSPAEKDAGYPGAHPQGEGLRPVTTSDYLFLFIRGEVVQKFGFLNQSFKYCWGAIHEYSYKLYRDGWFMAYYDGLNYLHLGGSTYGAKNTKTISREQYQQNAKVFAHNYFESQYGDDWDTQFWKIAQAQQNIKHNTYAMHRKLWASAV